MIMYNSLHLQSTSILLSETPYVDLVKMAEAQANHVQYQKEHINDNKTPTIVGVYVLGYVLAVTAVGLRLYSRRVSNLPYLADD